MNRLILAASFWSEENMKSILDNLIKWFMTVGKNILIAIVILIIGNKLIKWVLKLIGNSFKKTKIEPMVAKFLISLIKFALYFLIAIIVISVLGIPTTSLIAALSAAGLTLGLALQGSLWKDFLALQGSLSNFAGGVLILLFKPFTIGDYIKEDTHGNEGTVTGIDLFYTKITTIDNKTIVIPNGTLANSSLTNYTAQEKRRIDILIGISYDSDIRKAKSVLADVIDGCDRIIRDEEISIYVDNLGESQITLGVRVWTKTDEYWPVRWELLEKFKCAFDDNGIEIPFNQLSVTIKGQE